MSLKWILIIKFPCAKFTTLAPMNIMKLEVHLMSNPFKHLKYLNQKMFLIIIGLVLFKTLIGPNPIDIIILIGLILVFIGWFGDDCH